jgi:hypothetical protein
MRKATSLLAQALCIHISAGVVDRTNLNVRHCIERPDKAPFDDRL